MENESKVNVEAEAKPFNVDNELAQRKIERWGSNDNFVAPRELTLTITLCEYRNLIGDNARLLADNARYQDLAEYRLKELRERDARIAELETQVKEMAELETQVRELTEKIKAL